MQIFCRIINLINSYNLQELQINKLFIGQWFITACYSEFSRALDAYQKHNNIIPTQVIKKTKRWLQKITTNLTNQETRERGNHQLANIGIWHLAVHVVPMHGRRCGQRLRLRVGAKTFFHLWLIAKEYTHTLLGYYGEPIHRVSTFIGSAYLYFTAIVQPT